MNLNRGVTESSALLEPKTGLPNLLGCTVARSSPPLSSKSLLRRFSLTAAMPLVEENRSPAKVHLAAAPGCRTITVKLEENRYLAVTRAIRPPLMLHAGGLPTWSHHCPFLLCSALVPWGVVATCCQHLSSLDLLLEWSHQEEVQLEPCVSLPWSVIATVRHCRRILSFGRTFRTRSQAAKNLLNFVIRKEINKN